MKTQKELIIDWIKEHGSILPAKIAGTIYQGVMFGSETSKRCRELRKSGYLRSERADKFEVYYLAEMPKVVMKEKSGQGEMFKRVMI